jgi:cysteinyl-tRNA synthetase
MIAWVAAIADYARRERGVADFLVFPQNAEEIIFDDDDQLDAMGEAFLAAVDGIGIEDLFYDETTPRDAAAVQRRLATLSHFTARAKSVLVTDYLLGATPTVAADGSRAENFHAQARAAGLIPYAAIEDRDLNEIVTLATGEWPVSQPPPCIGRLE